MSTSIPAPDVHLSAPPKPVPTLPATGGSSPARPHTPLSSGFFLCNLFFKKSLYYFFIRLQQQLPGAWDFIFVVGGVGAPFCHLASVEHLGSIKTVKPSQCTLNLENNLNRPTRPTHRGGTVPPFRNHDV